MPEVSVIITAYNLAAYLEEAIQSALNQTYQNMEIIVVDDGSTDNTRELVTHLASPKINYIFQENHGAGAARNTGIRASTGRYIAFLDADDIWLPRKLELQLKVMESSPWASVIYCDMYFTGATDNILTETFFQQLKWPPPRGKVLDKMAIRSFGIPSTLLIKRDVFEKIGLFDEGLPYCDDYDMLLRMAAYIEFETLPTPLVKYRLHPSQISRKYAQVLMNHITVFNKAKELPGINDNIRKSLNIRLSDIHFQYAIFLIRKGNWRTGSKELAATAKSNFWMLFPLSLSFLKRTFNYLGRHIGLKARTNHIISSRQIET
jgi:glycosyltransferase involved in cell wall biosynthesis